MVKRLHWTDMGMCLDVAPDNRPLYVTASDYDAAQARIRDLEAENARLNMEMAAYRQGCTPADARAMLAVAEALQAHKDSASDAATDA